VNVKKTFTIVLSFLLVLPLLSFTGCSSENKETKVSEVETAAIVNGVVITTAEFQASFDNMLNRYKSFGVPLDSTKTDSLRIQILDSMITTELMFQKSTEEGYSLSDEELASEIDKIKGQYPTEELFKDTMEKQGLSEESFHTQLTRNLTIKKFVDEAITAKQVVTEEGKKAYYEEQKDSYKHDEEVGAKHILLKTTKETPADSIKSKKAEIDDLLARVKNGEDFSALATEHSDCPSSAQGGDLGYFGRGRMVKPFEEAAFSLKEGETSEVVETQFGFHIIQVYGKKEAGTSSYEEVEESITEALKLQLTQDDLNKVIEELKEKADIKKML